MAGISLIPVSEFERVRHAAIDQHEKLRLVADMCRANTLAVVKRAGSGHLGSSFSAMDIVVFLYDRLMNTRVRGFQDPNRDVYFSSKGHDVPGLYSVLFSLGIISRERFIRLRRLGGLDGHPDVGVPGIEANSGSLGMGISKGKGMAWAKRLMKRQGHVYVLTGDGELLEGQIYEALQTAAHQRVGNLTVIVDHNKVQSDRPVRDIVDVGDLGAKFQAFGWRVARCDGHDFTQIERALAQDASAASRPKIVIADTIKGCGVSFMEHPRALQEHAGLYPWHAGAPSDEVYARAHGEIIARISDRLADVGLSPVYLEQVEAEAAASQRRTLLGEPVSQAAERRLKGSVSDEYVSKAFGDAVLQAAGERADLVVLDADLASDCRVRGVEAAHPDRFIENGIAEQDMVSMAGGLARMGLLPVVNSFAAFLASRANEQVYNNASEGTKIIYGCHYAGLIPAGPGKSHQSIRDIALLGSLPNMVVSQPCNAAETRAVVQYCLEEAVESCAIRLAIGPSPRVVALPDDYQLRYGQGTTLMSGRDAILFAYGPVMLHEALLAAECLRERGFGLRVVNMPWLNRIDADWLARLVAPYVVIAVLDDHGPVGGLGDHLLAALAQTGAVTGRRFLKCAVEGYPACGTPAEALQHHGLDGISLADRIWHAHEKSGAGDAVSIS